MKTKFLSETLMLKSLVEDSVIIGARREGRRERLFDVFGNRIYLNGMSKDDIDDFLEEGYKTYPTISTISKLIDIIDLNELLLETKDKEQIHTGGCWLPERH